MFLQRSKLFMFVLLLSIAIGACGSNATEAPPLNLDELQTQIFATFSAQLTQTAFSQPAAPPAPIIFTMTPAPTISIPPSLAPALPSPTAGVAAACYNLTYSKDVTIPDNTAMTPGKSFTKTWEVLNSGVCKWDTGFKFKFINGDAMGGDTLTLPAAIDLKQKVEISVNMVAPNKVGKFTSIWKMTDANGNIFGDPLTVVIQVAGSTLTATPTKGTVTPTATNKPATATSTNTYYTATNTTVPPTATNTTIPPTAMNTTIPPTATNTTEPPTATATMEPPTATSTP